MKTDKQKRIEYLESQIQTMQDTVERLKKEEDAERSEFDFRTKMPRGSVWLGCESFEVEYTTETGPYFKGNPESCFKEIYHAHQIVKAAQRYIKIGDRCNALNDAVGAAEEAGVLQNLE